MKLFTFFAQLVSALVGVVAVSWLMKIVFGAPLLSPTEAAAIIFGMVVLLKLHEIHDSIESTQNLLQERLSVHESDGGQDI